MYCMVQINSLFKREKNIHQNRVQVFTCHKLICKQEHLMLNLTLHKSVAWSSSASCFQQLINIIYSQVLQQFKIDISANTFKEQPGSGVVGDCDSSRFSMQQ